MNETDVERLRHMIDAAQLAQKFASGKTRAVLDTDQQLEYALRQALAILGEAASKISQETRDQYPQIAWRGMVGMRNILVHGYFAVDLDQIWAAVTEDIPPLIAELERIIADEAE